MKKNIVDVSLWFVLNNSLHSIQYKMPYDVNIHLSLFSTRNDKEIVYGKFKVETQYRERDNIKIQNYLYSQHLPLFHNRYVRVVHTAQQVQCTSSRGSLTVDNRVPKVIKGLLLRCLPSKLSCTCLLSESSTIRTQ